MTRYRVTAWHGEGRSLFYVFDGSIPDGDQGDPLATFTRRDLADDYASTLNRREWDQLAAGRLYAWYRAEGRVKP